jgi:hypothetical protein
LENRSFGDAELRGKILDARCVIAVLGKMPQSSLQDASALGFEPRSRRGSLERPFPSESQHLRMSV